MISIELKTKNNTTSISGVAFEEGPSHCSRVAGKVKYCLCTGAFAIGGGICGMAGVFAYEWSRTSGSLSDATPIWMALGGVLGASCSNFLGLLGHSIVQSNATIRNS